MSDNFQQALLQEVSMFAEPVLAAGHPVRRRALFAAIGWDLEAVTGLPIEQLANATDDLSAALAELVSLVEKPPEALGELDAALAIADKAVRGIRELGALKGAPAFKRPPNFEKIGLELLDLLAILYLLARPVAYHLLVLLALVDPPADGGAVTPPVSDVTTGELVRIPHARAHMRLDRVPALVRDPAAHLKAQYFPNGLPNPDETKKVAAKLFPRVVSLLQALGMRANYGIRPEHGIDLGSAGNELAAQMFTFLYAPPALGGSAVGAAIGLIPATRGGAGVVVVPEAELKLSGDTGGWNLDLDASAAIAAAAIRASGITIAGPADVGSLNVTLTATKLSADGAAVRIGSTKGTRLELGDLVLRAHAALSQATHEIEVDAHAGRGAFVIAAGDGDGFLKKVLPAEGLRTEFDLGLGWSTTKGLSLRGAGGLEATLPVKTDLFPGLRIESVYVLLRASADGLESVLGATARVTLGPVTALVDRVGLAAKLTFPAGGGNLGPARLMLEFKPPSGAALKIGAGVAKGGGYIFFDSEKQQYAGVLQLELAKKIALKAIGLLTTRMPDGSPGFSLLVLITAEGFAPIPLGFGFTLTGIGGLLGVNRTMNTDVLRAGIKTGGIDSILFPKDPVRNAPAVVSNLAAVMPPAPGRFLIGPMAIIEWGTPKLVTLKLALVLELPAPVRLAILAKISVILPDEENAIVKLQMAAIGLIDFDKGELSLDATLFDSRILTFPLTGDMALRASWGAKPNFVLAIGGFNPRFPAPAGFPKLDRVSISLADSESLKLRLSAYVALTSNSVQFGARLDLFAAAAGFKLDGKLSFDALFQFDPFSFVIDISAGIALRHDGAVLMCIYLEATLSGPTPWHIHGKAHFELLFLKFTVEIDASFGPSLPPPAPAPVEVLPLLMAALRDARNWSAELPGDVPPLVSLRDPAGGGVLVHPLAVVTVRQRVVPLNRPITRFGNTVPVGDRSFAAAVLRADGSPLATMPVQDAFARAQFETMSDDAKLSAAAFDQMDAGFRIGQPGVAYRADLALDDQVVFETKRLDGSGAAAAYRLPQSALAGSASVGAKVPA
ncbi:MAG: hypothetical protein M3540_10525 [Actinomycetota bacterium]|nr:hypothetical protein [Actinomycetota bacterium]